MADCADCRFAELTVFEPCAHETEGVIAFECRRYPPAVMVMTHEDGNGEGVQSWPTVHAGDYCGEFQPSEETAA